MSKSKKALIAYALSLPEAYEDHPWGETVAKVKKKVFVFFGVPRDDGFIVCVKLPETGEAALMLPFTEPAGYGLGKSGWVMATIKTADRVPNKMLRGWILESYRAVAPKKLVASLDGAPAPKKKAATKKTAAKKTTAAKKKATAKKKTGKKAPPKRTAKKKTALARSAVKKSARKVRR